MAATLVRSLSRSSRALWRRRGVTYNYKTFTSGSSSSSSSDNKLVYLGCAIIGGTIAFSVRHRYTVTCTLFYILLFHCYVFYVFPFLSIGNTSHLMPDTVALGYRRPGLLNTRRKVPLIQKVCMFIYKIYLKYSSPH